MWTCLLLNVKSGKSSVLLQELHEAVVTLTASCLEGRHLFLIIDDVPGQGVISSCCQKLMHRLHVTLVARYEERSNSIFLGLIDVSPCLNESTHHLLQSIDRSPVSRSATHRASTVHAPGDGPGLHHEEGDITTAKRTEGYEVVLS